MGDVPATVAEGVRRAAGATAALSATEHPSPLPADLSAIVPARRDGGGSLGEGRCLDSISSRRPHKKFFARPGLRPAAAGKL